MAIQDALRQLTQTIKNGDDNHSNNNDFSIANITIKNYMNIETEISLPHLTTQTGTRSTSANLNSASGRIVVPAAIDNIPSEISVIAILYLQKCVIEPITQGIHFTSNSNNFSDSDNTLQGDCTIEIVAPLM